MYFCTHTHTHTHTHRLTHPNISIHSHTLTQTHPKISTDFHTHTHTHIHQKQLLAWASSGRTHPNISIYFHSLTQTHPNTPKAAPHLDNLWSRTKTRKVQANCIFAQMCQGQARSHCHTRGCTMLQVGCVCCPHTGRHVYVYVSIYRYIYT